MVDRGNRGYGKRLGACIACIGASLAWASVGHAGFFVELEWAPAPGATTYIVYENGSQIPVPDQTIYRIDYAAAPPIDVVYAVSGVSALGIEGDQSNTITVPATVWLGASAPALIRVTPGND